MTIKKAIEHFGFKLNPKNKIWKATKKDIDALDFIMGFVEDKHKQQLRDNELFAKMYIMVYAQYLERYKTTIFDDIPRKELHKLLARPLNEFIQRFTDRLNESELYALFDELEIKLEHPATKTIPTKEKENNTLKNALNNKNNKDRFSLTVS